MKEHEIKELVGQMEQGIQKAYESMYKETSKGVFFICMSFLHNEEDAKDAMQETYLTAYKKISQLKEKEKFVSWLNQIAINKCKEALRKNAPVLVDAEDLENAIREDNENFLPEEYITNKEKRKIVMDIMRKSLSDIQYRTVILYYFNRLTVEEIADIMECPPGTVKYRLSVARAKIRDGVVVYEKDTKDKLYSFAAVPLLVSLFAMEVEAMVVPDSVWKNIKTRMDFANSNIKNDENTSEKSMKTEGMEKMVKKTGFWYVKGKIAVITIATVALIGAGAGIAIGINKGNENENITEFNQVDAAETTEISEDISAETSDESILTEFELAENPAFYLNYHYDMLGESISDDDVKIIFFDDGINKITSNVTIEDLYAFIADKNAYSDSIEDWENVKGEYMTLDAFLDLEIKETEYKKDLNLRHNETCDIHLYSTTNINSSGENKAVATLEIENWFSDGAEHTARECLEAGFWNLEMSSQYGGYISMDGYETLPDYLFINAGTPDYITNVNNHFEEHQKHFISYLTTEFTEDTTNYQYCFYEACWISGNNVIRCFINETNEQKDRFITCYASPCGKAYMEYMVANRETVSSYSGYEPTYDYQLFLKDCGLK